jgi:hypothetical protein
MLLMWWLYTYLLEVTTTDSFGSGRIMTTDGGNVIENGCVRKQRIHLSERSTQRQCQRQIFHSNVGANCTAVVAIAADIALRTKRMTREWFFLCIPFAIKKYALQWASEAGMSAEMKRWRWKEVDVVSEERGNWIGSGGSSG